MDTPTETITPGANVRRMAWPTGWADLALSRPHGREAKRWEALLQVDFAKIGRGRANLPAARRKGLTRAATDHAAAVARLGDVIARTAAANGDTDRCASYIGRAALPGWVITATDGYAAILAPGNGRTGQAPVYAEAGALGPVTPAAWRWYATIRSLGASRPVTWTWAPERLTFAATDDDGDMVTAWADVALAAGTAAEIRLNDKYLAPIMGPEWDLCLTTGKAPAVVLTGPGVRVLIAGIPAPK